MIPTYYYLPMKKVYKIFELSPRYGFSVYELVPYLEHGNSYNYEGYQVAYETQAEAERALGNDRSRTFIILPVYE